MFKARRVFRIAPHAPPLQHVRVGRFFSTSSCESSSFIVDQSKIRNLAIIAHVDHGKTTLVDCLLKQSGALYSLASSNGTASEDGDGILSMDSNVLEKERRITILSKSTSVQYQGYRINIVDTPGHADFGGEVERVLGMVDGVALVVDATEGPMAQTKFVLSKALRRGLAPIVVVNKVDRETSRTDQVDSDILDLFCMLGANEKQMAYPILFASAKEGWATEINPSSILLEAIKNTPAMDFSARSAYLKERLFGKHGPSSMEILFKKIIEHVPPPLGDRSRPFSMLVNNIESGAYVGKCFLGKVEHGTVRLNDRIKVITPEASKPNSTEEARVVRLFIRRGLSQVPIEEAAAGDIISISGVCTATVNSTICAPEVTEALPWDPIDPPTLSILFSSNSSPLAGREGRAATCQQLAERLRKEAETNVALNVVSTGSSSANTDFVEVYGRGELHLAILIETMRREGLEFSISPPKVLLKTEQHSDGGEVKLEPVEEITIDLDEQYTGVIIDKLTRRKGELLRVSEALGKSRLIFKIPTRGLLGYHSEFKNDTHGTGVINHTFSGYEPFKGRIECARKGALISMAEGITTSFALGELEGRGTLFVGPGKPVYPGMVIGECSRSHDIDVNPAKTKTTSNYRAISKDEAIRLAPPRAFSLEDFIAYVAGIVDFKFLHLDDEMIEVTPKSIRLRKQFLDANERKKFARSSISGERRFASS
ncbi:hypothetical protein MDAP_002840 [Mitosporidium daphniae]|uniref:GTP-binding protein TypA n=1 Tax=Mitosporidium daphniae TaxID=1485682 RepID=A0A098VQF0_9MICR|nr:GTP-binding protein TypA [Mitosporidium daphniae]KGG51267.1 GTP-binding protein TypA [Mitosporidium daphniae]|eukprot:XP_013237694.1 GTP-binding protein TypA [Mitosporidium daphniae]